MHRWRGYEAAPRGWGRSVVTIGVFDGVHMGHQATIGHAVERAKGMGLPSLVLTLIRTRRRWCGPVRIRPS